MKKLSILFLVFLAFACVTCSELYAAKNPTAGIVNTNTMDLNVRSGAGEGYGVIGCLPKGTKVKINGKSGSWYKVSALGISGYCYASWIQVTESEEIDYSKLPKKEQEKIGRDLYKSADAANLATTIAE